MHMINRWQKLRINTITSLGNQVFNIACGFILPVLILQTFGSSVNGLVNSITQFLGFIALLDFGVGAVAASALYKPLVEKDFVTISKIYMSASKFFKVVAIVLLLYTLLLIIFYPKLVVTDFDYIFVGSLIACIAINLFAQYYFGVVNVILLNADQRNYVYNIVNIVTQAINVVACILLIKFGFGIHVIKLTTSLVFLLRPLCMIIYVSKYYKIDKHITYIKEPIPQKWNGMAQHFTSVVLSSTDVVVLTFMSTLKDVSIYAVYNLVVSGIRQMVFALTDGMQSLLGELWARQDFKTLLDVFGKFEWGIHTISVFVWGCTAVLIVSFVQVYTFGVMDADYIVPVFAFCISYANMCFSMRQSYYILVKAAGQYRETQSNQVITAVLNVILSVIMVKFLGLLGVAIGTLVAMLYQTVWLAKYISKNIIKWPMNRIYKQFCVDFISLVLIYQSTAWIELGEISYLAWGIMTLKVVLVAFIGLLAINIIFYKDNLIALWNKIKT